MFGPSNGRTLLYGGILGGNLVADVVESLVDNFVRDKAYPFPGSVVYCDLFRIGEHSGIVVNHDGDIVHLNGRGLVEKVTVAQFMGKYNSALTVYISSKGDSAQGFAEVAERAESMVGQNRDYNVLLDNCHQFSSGCITGNFENSDNFLWMLKDTAKREMYIDNWRAMAR